MLPRKPRHKVKQVCYFCGGKGSVFIEPSRCLINICTFPFSCLEFLFADSRKADTFFE